MSSNGGVTIVQYGLRRSTSSNSTSCSLSSNIIQSVAIMEFALKYENNVNEPTMMERDNGVNIMDARISIPRSSLP